MFDTCCINGQDDATQTQVPYRIEEIIENGQERYTDWILNEFTTGGSDYIFSDKIGTITFTTQNEDNVELGSFQTNTKGKSVLEQIESRIHNKLRVPAHWVDEGIAPPNMACKIKANEICKYIFEVYEKMPDRIAASKEEGIFIAFDSRSGHKSLYIEVYNDLEAGYLLNDNENKQIISSDSITDFEFASIINLIND